MLLRGLVGVYVGSDEYGITPPTAPAKLLPKDLWSVDLYLYSLLKVVAWVVAKVSVGAACVAIGAGVLAAAVRVDGVHEGHALDAVNNALDLYLFKKYSCHCDLVTSFTLLDKSTNVRSMG